MQAPQISQYSSPMQMPECAVESSAGAPSHGPPKQHGAAVSVGDWNSNNQQVPNLANGATDKAVSGNGGCLPSQGLSANDQSTSARDDGAPRPSKGDKERRKKNYDPDVFFKVNGKLYQKLGKIGSGGSSEVHKVISAECTIYALKKIKLRGRDYPTAYGFCQEIEYLNKLKGKSNIIQLIDYELMDVNESPVYLLLNPAINHSQKDLPVTIYESELHVINGSPQLIFVRSNYTIETVEAERISVDHVAHLKPSDGSSAATQLAAHLTGIHSAIKMLNSRVHVIHQYLVAMQRAQ